MFNYVFHKIFFELLNFQLRKDKNAVLCTSKLIWSLLLCTVFIYQFSGPLFYRIVLFASCILVFLIYSYNNSAAICSSDKILPGKVDKQFYFADFYLCYFLNFSGRNSTRKSSWLCLLTSQLWMKSIAGLTLRKIELL